MNILYCDACGTRIDENDSVLIKGKDFCAGCASKEQTVAPSRGSKTFQKLPRPASGEQVLRRTTLSTGVGPSGMKSSADAHKRQAPPESWMQRNMLLVALGVGVLGILVLIVLSSSPSRRELKMPLPAIALTTAGVAPRTPSPVTTAAVTNKFVGPGFLTAGSDLDIGLESAKETYENEIKPSAKKGNWLPLEKFLKEKSRFKTQAFFKEAEQMFRDIKETRRKALRPEFDTWLNSAKAGDWEARIDKPGPPKIVLPFNEKVATDKVSGHSGDKTIEALASEPIKWEDGGIFGQKAPALGGKATFEVPSEFGDFEKDQAFSFGCWVKLPSLTTSGVALIGHMDETADHAGWDLFLQGSEVAAHLIHSWPKDAIKVETSGTNIIKAKVWQHVFVTFDGSGKADGFKIFVDGKNLPLSFTTNCLVSSSHVNTPLTFGSRKTTSFVLPGTLIQDVRLYSRKLTSDEVLQLAFLPQIETLVVKAPRERSAKDASELFDAYSAVLMENEANGSDNQFFVKTDTTTKGTWTGVYGSQGGAINSNSGGPTFPTYATVAIADSRDNIWAATTADVRALQVSSGSSNRSATCWFSSTSFSIDVNLTDGQSHQVALYALDWDHKGAAGRMERIDLLDAGTGSTLNSQTVTSFGTGKWLVWNVSGHVKFVVTNVAGKDNNAVISGILCK